MIKKNILRFVRMIHKVFFQRNLPLKIAIYFHNIHLSDLPKFTEMLDYFKNHDYIFCDPDEYINKKGKSIFISFDDNYKEWLKISEFLSTRGITGTFYCNTGPFRGIASQDYLKEYLKRIEYKGSTETLSPDELIEIKGRYGQCIGSHSVNHFNLGNLSLDQAKYEITQDKRALELLLGSEIKHFSYPFGMRRFFNDTLRQFCVDSGYKTVANAIPGLLHSEIDPYNIPRTMWDFSKPLEHNLINLRIDGRLFESLTGKSPISYH